MNAVIASCSSLAVGYNDQAVLSGVSFQLKAGESLLVIGHNGTGKSTLLRSLFGLHKPLGGEISILGMEGVAARPGDYVRAGVRFLGQGNRSFDHLRVKDGRRVLCRLFGFEPGLGVTKGSRVDEYRQIGKLSVGERRLEALALLSAGNPVLYLLDEPLAGLDAANQMLLLEWLRRHREQRRTSFVIVEHSFRGVIPLVDYAMVAHGGMVSYLGEAKCLLEERKIADLYL